VGTCYQPIDRTPEQINRDIAIMKHARFNVVRMGDLSWDSFEPAPGKFEFEWFDKVMDRMQANGIRVILDIPGSPAPIWLHRAYAGVDIVSQNGTRLPPAERYMDNISDPDYVREVGIFADALTKRYAHHPAVIAVGYNNEIGNGFMSYSEADRQRFITWLKRKYGTIEELNKAWATQRWSRRLNVSVRPSTRLTRLGVRLYRFSGVCLAVQAAGVSSATRFMERSASPGRISCR
jgi:beta-galactosidase